MATVAWMGPWILTTGETAWVLHSFCCCLFSYATFSFILHKYALVLVVFCVFCIRIICIFPGMEQQRVQEVCSRQASLMMLDITHTSYHCCMFHFIGWDQPLPSLRSAYVQHFSFGWTLSSSGRHGCIWWAGIFLEKLIVLQTAKSVGSSPFAPHCGMIGITSYYFWKFGKDLRTSFSTSHVPFVRSLFSVDVSWLA